MLRKYTLPPTEEENKTEVGHRFLLAHWRESTCEMPGQLALSNNLEGPSRLRAAVWAGVWADGERHVASNR